MHDVVIVGAGAAGLMAGIFAARQGARVVLLDGAKKLGAKILVAGGGRCNVTHDVVEVNAYAGSSRNAIKKVLKQFDVDQTIAFFEDLGVTLKREETGKLFPTTDKARTVLDALLHGISQSGASIRTEHRVESITRAEQGFTLQGKWGHINAQTVILATGGRSLPKSGSDGHGYTLAKALGHSLTERIFPALVPLTLPRDHFICQLSGLTLPTTLTVMSGKKGQAFTNSTLCTHFGLSGPAPLDISRYYQAARFENPNATLHINWIPDLSSEQMEQALLNLNKQNPVKWLANHVPQRLAQTLCEQAKITGHDMTKQQRKTLVQVTTHYPLPITGNRGYNYAEVTAGGVPLAEVHLNRMASRQCDRLYLCGEICDVDGQIGGYNFQWAWSSGYIAGSSAGKEAQAR